MLPLKLIDQEMPKKGTIVDLGCGEGIIAKYLANNKNRKIIGVDLDKKRLVNSNQKNLSFKYADIRNFKFSNIDAVVISDVLHHMDFDDQKKVLKNISVGLKKKGLLIIKEIDTQEFIRGKLSRFWDFVFYPKDKIYFNNAKKLTKKLGSLGFQVTIKRPVRFFPGSTTLFICRK